MQEQEIRRIVCDEFEAPLANNANTSFPTKRDLLVGLINLLGAFIHKATLLVPAVRIQGEGGRKMQLYPGINKTAFLDLLPGYRAAKLAELRQEQGCNSGCILALLDETRQER